MPKKHTLLLRHKNSKLDLETGNKNNNSAFPSRLTISSLFFRLLVLHAGVLAVTLPALSARRLLFCVMILIVRSHVVELCLSAWYPQRLSHQ
jgi:hypothetical protein